MSANTYLDLIIDPTSIVPFYEKWRDLRSDQNAKLERGDVVNECARVVGVSKTQVYKYFNRLLEKQSVFSITRRSTHTNGRIISAQRSRMDEIAKKIAIIKIATETQSKIKYASTEAAMRIAIAEGLLDPEELPKSRSTIDRALGRLGLRVRDFKKQATAVSLKAHFPGEWLVVDATPLDQHFLRLDNRFKYRKDLPQNDKHLADILRREGLRRIWLFFAVDMFSGAWFCRAYAPEGGGEDTGTWIEFLTEAFSGKSGIPLSGIPYNLYSDRGSGLTSNETQSFLNRLGINVATHLPGNPRAKGLVEGRISAAKRSHETLLKGLEEEYLDLPLLNDHYERWQIYHNTVSGAYDKFCEGSKQNPIRIADSDSIRNARFAFRIRKLDVYGQVSVKWTSKGKSEKYFVSRDLPKGMTLHVYKDLSGQVRARDPRTGRVYDCDQRGKQFRYMGSFKNEIGYEWDDTEEQSLRKQIRKTAQKTKFKYESTLPPETPSREWTGKTVAHHIPDPFSPTEFPSIGDALATLEEATGDISDELLPTLVAGFKKILEQNGVITFDDIRKFIQLLKEDE